jgi:peptide/nickel transport system substrate-binding protein
MVAAGCGLPQATPAASPETAVRGGTLRVGTIVPPDEDPAFVRGLLDPATFLEHPLLRCCLTRTLLSYNGRTVAEGGTELQPDLAVEMPTVSSDGLTWTFRLREGVRYAPPLAERTIRADDFITALERTISVGEAPYYDGIEGVAAYRDGEAGTIAGVQAPDELTLVFRLERPVGEFARLAALHFLTPIPAEALVEHDADYAGFLVSSGPYMVEGADALDLTDPDAPPSWEGHDLGAVTVVRNPSWSPETDSLRPAYADRIEVTPFSSEEEALAAVERDEIHLILQPLSRDSRDAAFADPARRARVHDFVLPASFFIPLNVALPPFDDVHVRRAANWVVDRATVLSAFDPLRGNGVVLQHAFPDVVENGLLRDYAPFATPGGAGDVRLAREEMALSGYDADGDGRCDGAACTVVANPLFVGQAGLDSIASRMAEIGIQVTYAEDPPMADPAAHVAMSVALGWIVDYPSATDFAPTFTSIGLTDANWSLLGASPDQLRTWGYVAPSVPSLDDKANGCGLVSGSAGFHCWAEVDQLLTEAVAAWVPIGSGSAGWIVSESVDRFVFDDAEGHPSLDQITLRNGQ